LFPILKEEEEEEEASNIYLKIYEILDQLLIF
jgi:hypothetical protein